MPVRRQPLTLEELGTRRACLDLDGACRSLQALSLLGSSGQHVLEYAKHVLRPYYVNSLPGTVRSRMIDETSRSLYGRANDGSALFSGPTPLYLLTILLGPDVKRLKINLCCYYGCSHQADLLKLLSTEGTGIESLELARSALLRLDCQLLRTALENMRNLRSLTMRNIASDSILEAVGRSCPKLVVLDVACSQQVSDVGLQQLLVQLQVRVQKDQLRLASRENPAENPNENIRRHRHRRTTWSRLKALLKKFKLRGEKNSEAEEFLLDITETRNPICSSLRVINVAKTSVTNAGVSSILGHVPNLESLGEYGFVGRVVELKNRDNRQLKKAFGLKQARDSGTTLRRLEILAETCPGLEKLWILEPHHPAEAFRIFSSLSSLSIDALPAGGDWIKGFYDYLRTDGGKLRELNVRVARDEANGSEIDIAMIFRHCSNLVTLTVEGSRAGWLDRGDSVVLRRLKNVRIGGNVSADTIVKILTLAPEITALHAYSCNELTDQHLEALHGSSRTKTLPDQYALPDNSFCKSLTCFYVDEANKLSALSVINMFKHCKNLRHIGNLVNWGLNREEMGLVRDIVTTKNVDVELCPVANCFWNKCCQH